MREVEFRGKREIDGKWIYGDLKYGGSKNNHKKFTNILIWEDGLKVGYVIKKETLGQYTGLKDKNGTKIYEGDIIKAFYFEKEVTGKIEFVYGTFALTNSGISDNQLFIFEKLEVIGNIYDNPEILEG